MTDNPETGPVRAQDPRIRRRNRAMLVALLLLSMLPLIAAIWLYYGKPLDIAGARTNNGALLQPPGQLEELALLGETGPVVTGESRKWRVLYVAGDGCDDACFDRLHLLRQVQRLLGRESDRVLRLAVFPGGIDDGLQARLQEAFPRMTIATAPENLLADVLRDRELRGGDLSLPAAGVPASALLTVDPLGNVIFLHLPEQIGEPILSDLKRVLRLSNIG
ncbi:MAG: hypothetical protein U5R48_04950 [Gammaproteobacteria bacterium]|nr:hypothetical protein [Gammaproteobacteria bacterium]